MLLHDYRIFQEEYTEEDLDGKLRLLAQSKYDSMASLVINALDCVRYVYRENLSNDPSSVLHPLWTVWLLLELDQYVTSKTCIAALLHSTLKKRLFTSSQIHDQFGGYVLKLVQSIGNPFCCRDCLLEDHEARQREWREIMGSSHEVRSLRTFDDLATILSWKFLSVSSAVHSTLYSRLAEVGEMSLPLAHATNIHAYEIMQQTYEHLLK